MQIVREVAGIDPEPDFIAILTNALINIPEYKDLAQVYRNFVHTSLVATLADMEFTFRHIYYQFSRYSML